MAYTINVTSYDETSAVIHITDESDPSTPVSDLEVYVKEGSTWNSTPFAAGAKTDANGDVTVTDLVPGKTYGIWRQGATGSGIPAVTFTTVSRDIKIPTAAQWQDLVTRVKNAGGGGGLVTLSYGNSTWQDFIDAYTAGEIVYCRASSNANPATGDQTRMAFMAYVNNPTAPTEVEFQYVRSVSSKTAAQPCDQVFVYKLTSTGGGTWTVESRNVTYKVAAGTNVTTSYSSGTVTINADAPVITMTDTDPGEGAALAANNFIAVY